MRDPNDLLVQLVNDATSRFPQPELPEDPRERIVVATISLREALGTLPWAAEVLSVDGEGCIGRPDEQTLWFVDTIIGSAVDSGCTPDRAGELFRNLWLFTVGEIMVSAHGKAPRTELGAATLLPSKRPILPFRTSTPFPRVYVPSSTALSTEPTDRPGQCMASRRHRGGYRHLSKNRRTEA